MCGQVDKKVTNSTTPHLSELLNIHADDGQVNPEFVFLPVPYNLVIYFFDTDYVVNGRQTFQMRFSTASTFSHFVL